MIRIATRIRQARPEDVQGIATVHVETWRDVYAGIVPDKYILSLDVVNRSRYWLGALNGEAGSLDILVAENDEGEIIGFASSGPARKNSLPGGRHFDAELFTLYVAPNHQGLGLGRALMVRSFSALAARGCLDAFLWVVSANPARFFYEAMGGQRIAERTENFAGTRLAETAYGWDTLLIDA